MFGLLLETIIAILWVLYYTIEGFVLAILPASIQGKSIAGETVLVTGAGSGIGRLITLRFARLGCQLILWDIDSKGNEETARQAREQGVKVHTYTVDLSKREQIYSTAEKVKKEVGAVVDILVNNAGIVTGKKFLDCPDAMVEKTMEVNVMAHFWTVKSFLPGMMQRNHGHIVSMASSAGLIGVNGLADYCASKFAAVGFDESLSFELDAKGIEGVHTTVVCPYFISTGMFEGAKTRFPFILPVLKPEYVADKIIDAVRCNQKILILPRVLYVFFALKGIMPAKAGLPLAKFLGASSVMDEFTGREKKE